VSNLRSNVNPPPSFRLQLEMGIGRYSAATWDEVLEGSSSPSKCTLRGVAKSADEHSLFSVFNEYVCTRLAIAVGLPARPCVLLRGQAGELRAASLWAEGKCAVDLESALQRFPRTSAGVVAFDCWVANDDRGFENLLLGESELIPIDYDQGLFGPGFDLERMTRPDEPYAGGIAELVRPSSHIDEWCRRIAELPRWLIDQAVGDVLETDEFDPEDGKLARAFLTARQPNVKALLQLGAK
jgi:hypothetical protein